MAREALVGTPKKDATSRLLERMDLRDQQQDERFAQLTHQVELLRAENQKSGTSFAGAMKNSIQSKMNEKREGSRSPSASGSK